MDILSITNKSSVSSDAKIYTKDGSDFVTTTFDALYNKSSAKTNIEKSVSDANARIDNTNNTVAELDNYARAKANGIVLQSQGEMVTVNDSSDDYAVNLKPYGKSEQGEEPSPDYPQEIRSTVISEVRSCGKNLLKNTATSQTVSGVTFTVNEKDGSVTANGTATVFAQIFINGSGFLKGGNYTISGGFSDNQRLFVRLGNIYHNSGSNEKNFSVSNDSTFICAIYIEAGEVCNNSVFYPMIRSADIEDATYEPYTETVATLSEPITLYGIPTDSDGNFTDSNGQQWIADYINTARGKVVRCVNTEVFDGSTDENWRIQNGDRNFFTIDTSKHALSGTNLLCNIAPFGNVAVYNEVLGVCIVDTHILRYRYEINNNLTVDDVKQLLSQHNMIIYYPLATPTEEDLPTNDIVALKNLKTFYNITHVMNDSEVKGEMVLSYNADTKMYIDNKFAELAAQLV